MEQNTTIEFVNELGYVMALTHWAKMKGDWELIQALGGEKNEREHFQYLQTLVGNVVFISESVESYSTLNNEQRN